MVEAEMPTSVLESDDEGDDGQQIPEEGAVKRFMKKVKKVASRTVEVGLPVGLAIYGCYEAYKHSKAYKTNRADYISFRNSMRDVRN